MSQGGHLVKPTGSRKTWAIMYRDTEGVLRWEGKFRTKSNAQTRLSEVLNEIDRGTYSRPSSLSFEQFAKEWLLSRRQIRGSTEAGYSSLIDKQLIPRLGLMKVSRVRFEDIDAAVSGMIEDELASKTIRNAVMLLRNMLASRKGPSAFRRGLAFADSTLGKVAATCIPADCSARAVGNMDLDQGFEGDRRRRLPTHVPGRFLWNAAKRGLGLRFLDVRWFDNEIRIQHAISKRRCQNGMHKWEWSLGSPKSRKSLRGISATDSVMRLLADLKVGNADSGFIFSGNCHGFIDPDRFETDVWRPIVKQAELTGTRFHDLRHFFASQLIANGETAAYVRDQMGHSSIHVTFDTYGHLFPGRGREASDRYEKSMDAARRKSEAAASSRLAIGGDGTRKPDKRN